MKSSTVIFTLILILISSQTIAGSSTLYAVSPYNGDAAGNGGLMILNPATGLVNSAIDITYNGTIIQGANGLAIDPTTEIAYVVIKTANRTGSPTMQRPFKRGQNRGGGTPTRGLATLDLTTGVATLIADLGDNVAGITFDCDGQLYGVTGDGANTSESVYTIDKSTAAMSLLVTLGAGSDGETIGYNTDNDLLYTRSGRDTNPSFISIVPATGVTTAIGGTTLDEAFAMLWDTDVGYFLEANLDQELVSLQTDGTQAIIASFSNSYYKGLAWVPSKGCGGTPDVISSKTVSLLIDADSSTTVTDGDTLRYTIVTSNVGTGSTINAVLNDTPGANTALVVGSVTTSLGTVASGNTGGDTNVTVDMGTITSPAGTVTVTFDVTVNGLTPGVNSTISNQGSVSGDNFTTLLTDDPNIGGVSDVTDIIAVGAPLSLDAMMTVSLSNDADGTNHVTSGDTLSYIVTVTNSEVSDALNVMVSNTPDSNTTLINGSIVTTLGSVTTGNVMGDATVLVDVMTLPSGGGSVTITFDVLVNQLPFGHTIDITTQSIVTGDNINTVSTDDPSEPGLNDPTTITGYFITNVPALGMSSIIVLGMLLLLIGYYISRRKLL